jgi:hypothetical protein
MLSEDLIKSLVGMTESAANEATKGFEVQVTRRDDEVLMSDMMMNMNRVKIELEKGVVVQASVG